MKVWFVFVVASLLMPAMALASSSAAVEAPTPIEANSAKSEGSGEVAERTFVDACVAKWREELEDDELALYYGQLLMMLEEGDAQRTFAQFLGGDFIFYHTTSSPINFTTPTGTTWFSSIDTGDYYTKLYHSAQLAYSRTILCIMREDLKGAPKILDLSDGERIEQFLESYNPVREQRGLPVIKWYVSVSDLEAIEQGKVIAKIRGRGSLLDRYGSEVSKQIQNYIRDELGFDGVLESYRADLGQNKVFFDAAKWLECDGGMGLHHPEKGAVLRPASTGQGK